MLVFDIETDGLLDVLTRIHCLTIYDTETKEYARYNHVNQLPVEEGIRRLSGFDGVVGHNIIGFDLSAISKVYPWFVKPRVALDTLVTARALFLDMKDRDFASLRSAKLPHIFQQEGLVGKHKLEAWGFRLGVLKGTYKGGWEHWNQEMDDYCEQDVRVTVALLNTLMAQNADPRCLELEHAVEWIIRRQIAHGFAFNVPAAEELTQRLMVRRVELEESCKTVFAPWIVPDGKVLIPKRDNKKSGYVAGAPVQKIKWQVFNPGSRDQIADRLMKLYGWKPTEFTDGGKPQVDETVLDGLDYPRVKEIAEYMMVTKRLGQIAEGKNAWLKLVKDGRIHGAVDANGAYTGRMTHFNPNVAQVPKVGTAYGADCRALFYGRNLVGCDAEGLEMRLLAHFMAKYDGGAYGNAVVNGKKENATDAHSLNRDALKMNDREKAKTWFYAFVYGAGNYKLGTIILDDFTDEQKAKFYAFYPTATAREKGLAMLGKRSRDRLAANLPALGKLVAAVQATFKQRGYIIGLDGRKLRCRSANAALNTLLQSGGAVVMKQALVMLDRTLQETCSYVPGTHYEFCANIHDEWQIEVMDDGLTHDVGVQAADAIKRAGEHFQLRCPLAGSFAIGKTWRDTH